LSIITLAVVLITLLVGWPF
ncbi:unnamed protein product, partial [Allacma fusca]